MIRRDERNPVRFSILQLSELKRLKAAAVSREYKAIDPVYLAVIEAENATFPQSLCMN
jgi:hypothetical protein